MANAQDFQAGADAFKLLNGGGDASEPTAPQPRTPVGPVVLPQPKPVGPVRSEADKIFSTSGPGELLHLLGKGISYPFEAIQQGVINPIEGAGYMGSRQIPLLGDALWAGLTDEQKQAMLQSWQQNHDLGKVAEASWTGHPYQQMIGETLDNPLTYLGGIVGRLGDAGDALRAAQLGEEASPLAKLLAQVQLPASVPGGLPGVVDRAQLGAEAVQKGLELPFAGVKLAAKGLGRATGLDEQLARLSPRGLINKKITDLLKNSMGDVLDTTDNTVGQEPFKNAVADVTQQLGDLPMTARPEAITPIIQGPGKSTYTTLAAYDALKQANPDNPILDPLREAISQKAPGMLDDAGNLTPKAQAHVQVQQMLSSSGITSPVQQQLIHGVTDMFAQGIPNTLKDAQHNIFRTPEDVYRNVNFGAIIPGAENQPLVTERALARLPESQRQAYLSGVDDITSKFQDAINGAFIPGDLEGSVRAPSTVLLNSMADAGTFVHEMAHVLWHGMGQEMRASILADMGVGSNAARMNPESFANWLERIMRTAKPDDPRLQALFQGVQDATRYTPMPSDVPLEHSARTILQALSDQHVQVTPFARDTFKYYPEMAQRVEADLLHAGFDSVDQAIGVFHNPDYQLDPRWQNLNPYTRDLLTPAHLDTPASFLPGTEPKPGQFNLPRPADQQRIPPEPASPGLPPQLRDLQDAQGNFPGGTPSEDSLLKLQRDILNLKNPVATTLRANLPDIEQMTPEAFDRHVMQSPDILKVQAPGNLAQTPDAFYQEYFQRVRAGTANRIPKLKSWLHSLDDKVLESAYNDVQQALAGEQNAVPTASAKSLRVLSDYLTQEIIERPTRGALAADPYDLFDQIEGRVRAAGNQLSSNWFHNLNKDFSPHDLEAALNAARQMGDAQTSSAISRALQQRGYGLALHTSATDPLEYLENYFLKGDFQDLPQPDILKNAAKQVTPIRQASTAEQLPPTTNPKVQSVPTEAPSASDPQQVIGAFMQQLKDLVDGLKTQAPGTTPDIPAMPPAPAPVTPELPDLDKAKQVYETVRDNNPLVKDSRLLNKVRHAWQNARVSLPEGLSQALARAASPSEARQLIEDYLEIAPKDIPAPETPDIPFQDVTVPAPPAPEPAPEPAAPEAAPLLKKPSIDSWDKSQTALDQRIYTAQTSDTDWQLQVRETAVRSKRYTVVATDPEGQTHILIREQPLNDARKWAQKFITADPARQQELIDQYAQEMASKLGQPEVTTPAPTPEAAPEPPPEPEAPAAPARPKLAEDALINADQENHLTQQALELRVRKARVLSAVTDALAEHGNLDDAAAALKNKLLDLAEQDPEINGHLLFSLKDSAVLSDTAKPEVKLLHKLIDTVGGDLGKAEFHDLSDVVPLSELGINPQEFPTNDITPEQLKTRSKAYKERVAKLAEGDAERLARATDGTTFLEARTRLKPSDPNYLDPEDLPVIRQLYAQAGRDPELITQIERGFARDLTDGDIAHMQPVAERMTAAGIPAKDRESVVIAVAHVLRIPDATVAENEDKFLRWQTNYLKRHGLAASEQLARDFPGRVSDTAHALFTQGPALGRNQLNSRASLAQVLSDLAAKSGLSPEQFQPVQDLLQPLYDQNQLHFQLLDLTRDYLHDNRPIADYLIKAALDPDNARTYVARAVENIGDATAAGQLRHPAVTGMLNSLPGIGPKLTAMPTTDNIFGRQLTPGTRLTQSRLDTIREALTHENTAKFVAGAKQDFARMDELIAQARANSPIVANTLDQHWTPNDVMRLLKDTNVLSKQDLGELDDLLAKWGMPEQQQGLGSRVYKLNASKNFREQQFRNGLLDAYSKDLMSDLKLNNKLQFNPQTGRVEFTPTGRVMRGLNFISQLWRSTALASVSTFVGNWMDAYVRGALHGRVPFITRDGALSFSQDIGIDALPQSIYGHIASAFQGDTANQGLAQKILNNPVFRFQWDMLNWQDTSVRSATWAQGTREYLEQKVQPRLLSDMRELLTQEGMSKETVDALSQRLKSLGVRYDGNALAQELIQAGASRDVAFELGTTWQRGIYAASDYGESLATKIQLNFLDERQLESSLHLRTWLPFHTWASRNIPFYLQTAAENPWLVKMWSDYHDITDQQRQQMGLTPSFVNKMKAPGSFQALLSVFLGNGTHFFNPLTALSITSQIREPRVDDSATGLGKLVQSMSAIGMRPAPWIDLPLNALGLEGKEEPMGVLRQGDLIAGLAPGLDLKPTARITQWVKNQLPWADHEQPISGSTYQDYLINKQIRLLALEAGITPTDPRYAPFAAATQDPSSPIYRAAEQMVRSANLHQAVYSNLLPIPHARVDNEELAVRQAGSGLPTTLTPAMRSALYQSGDPATLLWALTPNGSSASSAGSATELQQLIQQARSVDPNQEQANLNHLLQTYPQYASQLLARGARYPSRYGTIYGTTP